MDPATAAGLGIGVVSLVFDVFENSVKCELNLDQRPPALI